jgi:hypothetical protein
MSHELLAQGAAADHCPSLPHVCTPVPAHWVAPGSHTPVQAPDTHAWPVHELALPHAPLALHV